MIPSKALVFSDYETAWYKKWGAKLKQTEAGRGNFSLRANKFWQNAVMAQILDERGALASGKRGLGFGVGQERLPALFASLGVKVTATDQDFKTSRAAEWDNDQLAHGAQSLNLEKICPEPLFKQNVEYMAVNMKKIPKKLDGKYDFLWSNCALGHLGSINDSLAFLEDSLRCLKPGGWAVHTTEANILSNSQTLDNAGTVFFRQRDLLKLFTKLSQAGYIVSPLHFNLGRGKLDRSFTVTPEWGSDFSKILFDGYMATQIVLLIHRPLTASSAAARRAQVSRHQLQYWRNLASMQSFMASNAPLRRLLAQVAVSRGVAATAMHVRPTKPQLRIRAKAGQSTRARLEYSNDSKASLFKLHASFSGVSPLVVATYGPVNRPSVLANDSWYEPNRPTIKLLKPGTQEPVEYVPAGQPFAVEFEIATDKLAVGKYNESFCLVKEGDGVIPASQVELLIAVT